MKSMGIEMNPKCTDGCVFFLLVSHFWHEAVYKPFNNKVEKLWQLFHLIFPRQPPPVPVKKRVMHSIYLGYFRKVNLKKTEASLKIATFFQSNSEIFPDTRENFSSQVYYRWPVPQQIRYSFSWLLTSFTLRKRGKKLNVVHLKGKCVLFFGQKTYIQQHSFFFAYLPHLQKLGNQLPLELGKNDSIFLFAL